MSPRIAHAQDAPCLLELYASLVQGAPIGGEDAALAVLAHPGTQIWCQPVGETLGAMATLHLLPNATQSGRPYALIENVVTLPDFRGQGYGRAVMQAAIAQAWEADAYKIMLMTGKAAGAKGFYERLGFTADEKWGMSLRRAPLRRV